MFSKIILYQLFSRLSFFCCQALEIAFNPLCPGRAWQEGVNSYSSAFGQLCHSLGPLDFISRLVALVPRPRVNLTRFHGVFAPNSKYRVQITPAKRGRVNIPGTPEDDRTPAEHRAAMTWAQRLKRVFNIDVETCSECGGDIKIIASIEDPAVIQKILAHLDENATSALLPDCRASPTVGLFA